MNNRSIKFYLESCLGSNKLITGYNVIKYKHPQIFNEIFTNTTFLTNPTFNQRLYHVINNINFQPKCECNKLLTFYSYNKGYANHCKYCALRSKERSEKIKNTYKKRTGFDNPSQNPEIQNKMKETFVRNYGVDNPSKSEIVKTKRINTNKKRFGVDYTFQAEEVKVKIKDSMVENYGVDNFSKTEDFKIKYKETCQRKYGVDSHTQTEEFIGDMKKLMLKKYGYETNLQLPAIKLKAVKALKKIQFEKSKCKLTRHKNIEYIKTVDYKLILKCKECKNIFEVYHQFADYCETDKLCPTCYPRYKNQSKAELEITEYLKDLGLDIIERDRTILKPKELDIYIPSKKVAIEYNGLYWHSEAFIPKDYHLEKTKKCKEKGIRLIHIFEDEWQYKKEIVKSRLEQILKVSNTIRIHARKCTIKEIEPKIKNEFLDRFHIQGKDISSIKLGTYHDNELISVMTFSKGSISKGSKYVKGIWELNRFCTNSKYHIPGIASKMLTYFKRNFEWKEIFSYADKRWSDGNVYEQIGFENQYDTKPNYWYVDGFQRIHRFNLRKTPNDPKDIPEWKLRLDEGFIRIWDCGHYKYNITNSES